MLYIELCLSGGDLPGECNSFEPDVAEIDTLLKHGADPNIRLSQDNYNTAIHYAARYGVVKVG